MGDEFIPAEILAQVGMELPEKTIQVEKGEITSFAEAIGNDDPRYREIAPPTFIVRLTMGLAEYYRWDFGRMGIHGGEEYEYFCPIKAGDTITCKTRISEIYEKESKRGKMAFMILDSTLENQDIKLVAKIKRTRIRM